MTKIEILGVPQNSLGELVVFIQSLKIKDLEISVSTDRVEVWTSVEDTGQVSQMETQLVAKATTFTTIRSKVLYKVPPSTVENEYLIPGGKKKE